MNKDNLIELLELKVLLGYTDLRSVEKWCKEHNTPVMLIGKIKYVHAYMLENAFLTEMHRAMLLNGHEQETANIIINAITADDKISLAKAMDAPVHENQISNFENKKNYNDIINKYKVA